MALVLTTSDNADSTGLTCTVAGADPATTVTFWTAINSVLKVGSANGWVNSGTRSGDGTKALSLAPGYYMVYASGTVGGAPAVSVPVQGLASIANKSLILAIRDACVARIQTVDFTPLAGARSAKVMPDRVLGLWEFDAKNMPARVQFPAVIVAPFGSVGIGFTGTVSQDDIGYGMLVGLLASIEATEQSEEDTFALWHERIRHSLISQRLDGIAGRKQMFANLDPRPAFDWGPPNARYGRLACWNQFRFIAREVRGV